LAGCLFGWLVGRLVGWLVGRSVGRSVGRPVGRSVGRLVSCDRRLVRESASCLSRMRREGDIKMQCTAVSVLMRNVSYLFLIVGRLFS
jgi:hypothetical protein